MSITEKLLKNSKGFQFDKIYKYYKKILFKILADYEIL